MDSPPGPRRLIITVHGIRTFGNWQERLEALVRERDPAARVQHYKYGYFSCLAFMLPFLRWWVTRRFRRALLATCAGSPSDRIEIVAHSFGTHLVAWGLHGIARAARPRIDTLILAGSVLKPTFPWVELTDGCVGRVVNDCGTQDSVLVLNQAVVLFTGMAGRVGFAGMSNERFRNRFFAHGHSGYFLRAGRSHDEFMRTWWLPVLLSDEPVVAPEDKREATAFQGLVAFALNNAEPVKVAVYLAPFVALTILFFGLYKQADRERGIARGRLVDLQVAYAEKQGDAGDIATALVWYAEALRSSAGTQGGEFAQRDQRVRFATALRQYPRLEQLLFLDDVGPSQPALDREGTLLALSVADATEGGARVWDVATGLPATPYLPHTNYVKSIAFSPDGERVATASHDHTARVWNSRTGAPVTPPLEHVAQVKLARFSPDGERLLTLGARSGPDGLARASVWDVRSAARLGRSVEHEYEILDASFSRDGKRVLTISDDGLPRVWDAASGEALGPAPRHEGNPVSSGAEQCAAFSPDGRTVASSNSEHVFVWDVESGTLKRKPWTPRNGCIRIEYVGEGSLITVDRQGAVDGWLERLNSPDGARAVHGGVSRKPVCVSGADAADERSMVVVGAEGFARVWDLYSSDPRTPTLRHSGAVKWTCISESGARVGTIDELDNVRVFDLSTKPSITLRPGDAAHGPDVRSACFDADGSHVLSVSLERSTVYVWDAASGALHCYLEHADFVESAQFSPDGRRVLTASRDRTARLSDARTGERVGAVLQHADHVKSAGFSSDGTRIVTGCQDGTVHLWSADDGAELRAPISYGPPILCVSFAPDGRSVLVAGGVSARLFDAQTGERLTEGPPQNEEGLSAAALSPDGMRIATGGMDGVVRVWDARTGEPLTPPLVHSSGRKPGSYSLVVNHVAFSPDSGLIASASSDGQTRIWNVANGVPAAPPLSDADQYATFSPDGRWIATAGASGLVRVWDVRTGAALSPPLRHADVATCVAFDARGLRLVSASMDGTARIWDLAPDDRPLEELQRLAEVLAGRRIDETGGVVDLTTDELRTRWEALRGATRR